MIEKNKLNNFIMEIIITTLIILISLINLKIGFFLLTLYFFFITYYNFLKINGERIKLYNLFLYASSMMTGTGSIVMFLRGTDYKYSFIALLIVLLIIVITKLFYYENNKIIDYNIFKKDSKKIIISIIITIIFTSLISFIPSFKFIKNPMTFAILVSIVIITLILTNKKIIVLLVMGITFLYYYFFEFSGFGRINILALILSYVILYNQKFPSKKIKLLMIISFLPGMILGTAIRNDLGEAYQILISGKDSITSPQIRFIQLLEMFHNKEISLFYGRTIWAALVTPIPRKFWPNKPWNFNREVTWIFSPHLVEYGHSDVGSIFGEMILNFHYFGLIIFIYIFLKIIKRADEFYIDGNTKNKNKYFIRLVNLTILISGIIDIYWGGPSTFMSRGGFRIILFTIMYGLISKIVFKIDIK